MLVSAIRNLEAGGGHRHDLVEMNVGYAVRVAADELRIAACRNHCGA